MIEWLDKHLISEWRDSWRFASVQMAAIFSAITGTIAASPALALNLLDYMPHDHWGRTALIALVVLVVFIVPTLARLWDQRSKDNDAAQ